MESEPKFEQRIDDKEKAEYVAYAENRLRSKIEKTIAYEMEMLRKSLTRKAENEGYRAGEFYDKLKEAIAFLERNKTPKIIDLGPKYGMGWGEEEELINKLANEHKGEEFIVVINERVLLIDKEGKTIISLYKGEEDSIEDVLEWVKGKGDINDKEDKD